MSIRIFGKNIVTAKHHLIMEYSIPTEMIHQPKVREGGGTEG